MGPSIASSSKALENYFERQNINLVSDTACLGPAMGLGLACVPNCFVNDGKHQNIYPVSDTAFGVLMGDVAQRVFRIDFWKL